MSRSVLQGKRIVVTRPAGQADHLIAALQVQGAIVRPLPLLAIEASRDDGAALAGELAAADADTWIFTSTNAVAPLARCPQTLPWPREVVAIGPATRRALAGLGVNAWAPAAGSRSEDLLDDPRLATLRDRQLLIIGGEGGRPLLGERLAALGARVSKQAVYRRVAVDVGVEDWAAAMTDADVVVFTSAEAMTQYQQLATRHAGRLPATAQWLVISPRLVAHAKSLGYAGAPLLADGADDVAVIRALTSHFGAAAAMTESSSKSAEPSTDATALPQAPTPSARTIPPVKPRSGLAWFAVFLAVLALMATGAMAAGGYWLWQQQQRQAQQQAQLFDQIEERAIALGAEQRDAADLMQQVGAQTAALQLRMDGYDETLGQLREHAEGDRLRVTLASIEQLLLLANERLLLAADPDGAALALARADQRLAALSDPRLHRVREAIASERAALAAMPRPDRDGVALTLASLIEQVDSLPLSPRIRHLPDLTLPDVDPGSEQPLWDRLRGILTQLFVLRRDDGDVVGALPDTAAATVSLLMHSKLENARAAWLARDLAGFQQILTAAQLWLTQHFAVEQPAVVAMDAALRELQQLPTDGTPPDLGRSLTLLRAQLDPEGP
jgi:uncharacterized protein HemX/uroporphyrinogen-III synthase